MSLSPMKSPNRAKAKKEKKEAPKARKTKRKKTRKKNQPRKVSQAPAKSESRPPHFQLLTLKQLYNCVPCFGDFGYTIGGPKFCTFAQERSLVNRFQKMFCVAAVACSFVAPALSQEKVDLETISRIRYEGFRNSKVMEFASGLTDSIGERLTGSP